MLNTLYPTKCWASTHIFSLDLKLKAMLLVLHTYNIGQTITLKICACDC